MVVDRGGFRFAIQALLEDAHRTAAHDVALLATGAQHAPVEVIEDLNAAWLAYRAAHPEGSRCTLLLTVPSGTGPLGFGAASTVELVDLAESEVAGEIGAESGALSPWQIEDVARFTGGIPGLVQAIGAQIRSGGGLPTDRELLLHSVGGLADEMRGAVDIVTMNNRLAERLDGLLDGRPAPLEPGIDRQLEMAGLIRSVRAHGMDQVALRAPAIATLVG
jgi:hypothetical protein